jgi:hypothetical protein
MTNWTHYFTNEARKPEYGTFDHFDNVPPKYVGNAEEFKEQIESNPLETILLIPGADHQTVRVLHNCAVVENDQSKVSVIFGLNRFSPLKQVAISSLVKPFLTPSAVTRSANTAIPTVEDFKACTSGDEFAELVGSGTKNTDTLARSPTSFWLHPHLMGAYITSRQVTVASIGESYVLAIEEMSDEDATILTNQYYNFLVFAWAVANVHAQPAVKLLEPSDEDNAEKLFLRAQHKLDKAGNRDNDDNEGREGDVEEYRGRTESPDRNAHGRRSRRNRREEPRGRYGRRNQSSRSLSSGSPSRSRSRSRSPTRRQGSRSDSPSPRGRGRNRQGQPDRPPNRGRDRSPEGQDVLRQLSRGIAALAQAQNENLQRARADKSVLGKLSQRQRDLFTLLAAKDWNNTSPMLNEETENLLSYRAPEKQWNLIDDWSRSWPGLVSKQGVVQFLSSGYASRTLPGGFTVFMFSPLRVQKPTDKKDRIRNIKGTFGKEGSLDDEAIDFYATLDYFVPMSLSDAETQLELAVLLLEKLTHKKGIAIDGYLSGLDIIAKHRLQMLTEQNKDNMFLARFLHFLDMVFNTFCDDLAGYHTRSVPIESAKRHLEGRMTNDINRVMRDINLGITPNLPLPSMLLGDTEEQNPPSGASPRANPPPSGDDKTTPEWWVRNPEVVRAWALPDDKSMKTLFTSSSPEGKENLRLFPKILHHNPKISGKKSLCVKYQCKGRCRAGCPQAHLRPAVMAADVKAQIASAFRKLYT